jgi:hypothetical protein
VLEVILEQGIFRQMQCLSYPGHEWQLSPSLLLVVLQVELLGNAAGADPAAAVFWGVEPSWYDCEPLLQPMMFCWTSSGQSLVLHIQQTANHKHLMLNQCTIIHAIKSPMAAKRVLYMKMKICS